MEEPSFALSGKLTAETNTYKVQRDCTKYMYTLITHIH